MTPNSTAAAPGYATISAALSGRLTRVATSFETEWSSARLLRRAGLMPPLDTWFQTARTLRRSGVAGIAETFALRRPTKPAVIDADGALSYGDLATSVTRWTNALRAHLPAKRQPTVALMCRNSRYLMIALLGALGVGARTVFLNTDLGSRQLATVCERDGIELVIHDAEFSTVLDGIPPAIMRVIAHPGVDADRAEDVGQSMTSLMAAASAALPARPAHRPDIIILTSGSTGTPKGAARGSGGSTSLATAAGLLERIPLRGSDRIFLAPPAFHGWGLIISMLALAMGATLVFDRRFDARRCARMMAEHRCSALIAVPTMLQRLASADDDLLTPMAGQLRIVASGGASLNPAVVQQIQTALGPVLHNLYGSTEASYISIATPQDLAADPRCAGRPALGVEVKIIDQGAVVDRGQSGEIYVRTAAQISQYTDGRTKDTLGGLLRTGDVGRLDAAGRLIVEGRADGMVVSGGENVFPEFVELTLLRHGAVSDAKVITVEDTEFGQCLLALIVPAEDGLDIDTLRRWVATELSRSWVPRRFVLVPALTRTATGKVTHATVQSLLAEHSEETTP